MEKKPAFSVIAFVLTYGFLWVFTFSFLWFLVSSGISFLPHPQYLGRFLFGLVWNVLCPEWPFLAMGLLLGLLVCLLAVKLRGAVRASLILSILPVGIICFFFSFTISGFVPALLAVLSSFAAGSIVARTWQETVFGLSYLGRSFAANRVLLVIAGLVALSIPLWLLEGFAAVWSQGDEVTETSPAISPGGTYVAVIHNVNPGIGDYSDVIIRPRHTVLNLFAGYSASSRYMGVDRIQWSGKRTLHIWCQHDAGQDRWHDVPIVYFDIRDAEERKENNALKKAVGWE